VLTDFKVIRCCLGTLVCGLSGADLAAPAERRLLSGHDRAINDRTIDDRMMIEQIFSA
jgi:hypothetical protein